MGMCKGAFRSVRRWSRVAEDLTNRERKKLARWRTLFSQVMRYRAEGKEVQAAEYEEILRDDEAEASAELLAIFQAERSAAQNAIQVNAGRADRKQAVTVREWLGSH